MFYCCVCYFIRILVQVWVWWYNILLWWPFSYIGHSLTFSKSKFRFTEVSLRKSDVRLKVYKDDFKSEVSYVGCCYWSFSWSESWKPSLDDFWTCVICKFFVWQPLMDRSTLYMVQFWCVNKDVDQFWI